MVHDRFRCYEGSQNATWRHSRRLSTRIIEGTEEEMSDLVGLLEVACFRRHRRYLAGLE